jgi:ribosomal protein S27E
MEDFATNKMTDVKVCFVNTKCADCENNEVVAKEVEYCIASGFVKIITDDTVYITHISNAVLKKKA